MNTLAMLVLVAVALAACYNISNPEKRQLNDATRARLGGSYAGLSAGVSHYALAGPGDGPAVVLIHGGVTPLVTWDEYVPDLTDAGLRILRYDLHGRGSSDHSGVMYDRGLYRRHLLGILDWLGLAELVDLVGYSVGGAFAVDFAVSYPERVRRLVVVGPLVHTFSLVRTFRPPVLGEFIARIAAWREAVGLAAWSVRGTEAARRCATALFEQATFRGHQVSLVSMLRTDATTEHLERFKAFGEQNRRVLLVRGTRDEEISASAMEEVRAVVPLAEYHAIHGATHALPFEKSEEVRPLVVRLLKEE